MTNLWFNTVGHILIFIPWLIFIEVFVVVAIFLWLISMGNISLSNYTENIFNWYVREWQYGRQV